MWEEERVGEEEGGGGLWAVSKVEMYILLGSFSDTLFLVSILDIVYAPHLQRPFQS